MKFALASYGTRGDIEPCATVGRELLLRGHEVCMAVPPNLVEFVESTGIAAVAYGPDSKTALESDFLFKFWMDFPGSLWRVGSLTASWRDTRRLFSECWADMSRTLTSLADGADLLMTGLSFEQQAVHVADYHHIPLVTMHPFPVRPNGQIPSPLPHPLTRSVMSAVEWLHWFDTKTLEDRQRRELGLSRASSPAPRLIAERGSLEIQAYDEACFPGLAAEWGTRRPIVGTLTMDLTTEADDEVASWMAAGTPPIYFGFGSIPVQSPAETLTMISTVCEELGERALVCSGWSDFDDLPQFDHVRVVGAVSHAAVFPACRAVVHHGGLGTTATGLRAGKPTLILWTLPDVHIRGAVVKQLRVGATRRLSATTPRSLVADLRTILAPEYAARARKLASSIRKSSAGAAAAADLVEELATSGLFGNLSEHAAITDRGPHEGQSRR
jgi:UDP:flavonoid glycosyltransferase YjiC (YdhE family)